ncbi:Phosphatidylinositol-4-phosphate 5-kinase [Rhizoclosmatium sp. JEL0117]|nr:Phosphatidylinositol-4-phosphate 5-kinase [Rhizoclosmatium sp. JEL0117]
MAVTPLAPSTVLGQSAQSVTNNDHQFAKDSDSVNGSYPPSAVGVASDDKETAEILTLPVSILGSNFSQYSIQSYGSSAMAAEPDSYPADTYTTPVYPTKTPPRRSTYHVWEQNNIDGVIVEEQVEVNIPFRNSFRHSLMRRSRHSTGEGGTSTPTSPRWGPSDNMAVGTPVKEGHANYLLMYDMLTGIRVSVSRVTTRPDRLLEDADYSAAHKLAFDVAGNEMMPKAIYDFKFKDYAPWVFRHIRDIFMIDAPEYLLSLTGKYVLSELGSPGKSGSFFYFSQDYRFIIKTISKTEHKFFRRILRAYYEVGNHHRKLRSDLPPSQHVKANPDTLLCRILGLHRVKVAGGKKIPFVVMGNVFPANKDVHETFDLKGSTVGRVVKPDQIKPHSTLKDLNFIQMGKTIHLGPHKKEAFLRQLERDTLFLQMMNIMDYSLLLGIHNLETGNRENIRDNTLAAFEPNPETLVRRRTVRTGTGSRSRSNSGHRRAVTDPVLEPTRAILPDDSPPERQYFAFYSELGGIKAADADGEEEGEVYFMGIIDIFTEWSPYKKVEHFFKSLLGNGRNISAVNSVSYGRRFMAFIEKACR